MAGAHGELLLRKIKYYLRMSNVQKYKGSLILKFKYIYVTMLLYMYVLLGVSPFSHDFIKEIDYIEAFTVLCMHTILTQRLVFRW